MPDLTVADLAERIAAMERDLGRVISMLATSQEVVALLLARLGNATHLPIEDAARLLSHLRRRKVSPRTVQRMIAAGELQLERIPGSQHSGIPIAQLHAGWTDVRTLRTAAAREGIERG